MNSACAVLTYLRGMQEKKIMKSGGNYQGLVDIFRMVSPTAENYIPKSHIHIKYVLVHSTFWNMPYVLV